MQSCTSNKPAFTVRSKTIKSLADTVINQITDYENLHETTTKMYDSDSDNEPLFADVRRFLRQFSTETPVANEAFELHLPPGRVPKSLGDFDTFLKPLNVEITLRESSGSASESSLNHSQTSISSPEIVIQQVADEQPPKQIVSKAVRWDLLPSQVDSPKNTRRSPASQTSANVLLRLDSSEIQPKYILSVYEQTNKIIGKLLRKFGSDLQAQLVEASYMLGDLTGKTGSNGIHVSDGTVLRVITNNFKVFIDISNIEIGFYDRLKANRDIEKTAMKKAPPFSFPLFTLILERGRRASKRILAGSISHQFSASQHLPAHITQAEKCGYEINILERVYKPQDVRKMKRAHRARYSTTSGNSSASESASSQPYVTKEQAVDEILHLKMCQSILDQINRNERPTTMVIASGDSAPAEFSDGFFRNVERALSAGWNIEVVAWADGLGRDYRAKHFLQKWARKFMIIELDDFAEDLLASYAPRYVDA